MSNVKPVINPEEKAECHKHACYAAAHISGASHSREWRQGLDYLHAAYPEFFKKGESRALRAILKKIVILFSQPFNMVKDLFFMGLHVIGIQLFFRYPVFHKLCHPCFQTLVIPFSFS